MRMAIIRKSKTREMSDSELSSKLFEFQKELNTERGMLATGGRTSNPGKIRTLRRTIARIMTILHEKKLGIVRKVPGKKIEEKKVEEKKTETKKQ
jgi:large subunit ribosomal protein L29